MLLPRADGIFNQPICEHAFFFSLLVPLIVCNDIVNKINFWLNLCQRCPDVAEFSSLKKWVNIHCNTSLKVSLNFQLGIEANRSQTLKLCTQGKVAWLHPFHILAVVHNFDRESQPSAFSPYCPLWIISTRKFLLLQIGNYQDKRNTFWLGGKERILHIFLSFEIWHINPLSWCWWWWQTPHRSQAGIQA